MWQHVMRRSWHCMTLCNVLMSPYYTTSSHHISVCLTLMIHRENHQTSFTMSCQLLKVSSMLKIIGITQQLMLTHSQPMPILLNKSHIYSLGGLTNMMLQHPIRFLCKIWWFLGGLWQHKLESIPCISEIKLTSLY